MRPGQRGRAISERTSTPTELAGVVTPGPQRPTSRPLGPDAVLAVVTARTASSPLLRATTAADMRGRRGGGMGSGPRESAALACARTVQMMECCSALEPIASALVGAHPAPDDSLKPPSQRRTMDAKYWMRLRLERTGTAGARDNRRRWAGTGRDRPCTQSGSGWRLSTAWSR